MPAELTTLHLARKIADAVALALLPAGMGQNRSDDDTKDPPTQAVIAVLHATGSWLCRWEDTPGGTDDRPFGPVGEGLRLTFARTREQAKPKTKAIKVRRK